MIGNPSTLQLQVNGLQAQLKQKVKELSVANEDSISNLVIQVKNLKDLIGSYQTDLRRKNGERHLYDHSRKRYLYLHLSAKGTLKLYCQPLPA